MSIKIDEYGIRCLIQTGKKQGYLYMEDLLEDLRYLNLDDEQMDTIVNIFVDLGISIHKKNEDVSSARNEGLKVANEKDIAFVDSDDYIEKERKCMKNYIIY